MSVPIVLLGHGSPDPRHSDDLHALAARLATRLTTGAVPAQVGAAFLEHNPPPLADAAQQVALRCADDRADVHVVPLFFSAGYHVRHDVPGQVAEAGAACVRPVRAVPPPLLTDDHPWTLAALEESAAAADCTPDPRQAAVVVTAGSSDPDVLRGWDAAARRWARDGPWAAVEVAHASGPGRRPEAVAHALRRRSIDVQVLVPALLARGVFADRVAAHATDLGVGLGGIVGATDALVERLRAEAAVASRHDRQPWASALDHRRPHRRSVGSRAVDVAAARVDVSHGQRH